MNAPIRSVDSLRQGWRMTQDSYWLFFAVCFVGLVLGGAVPILLTGPLTCGIFRCYLAKAKGQRVSFELLFEAFDVFVPSAIACALYTVVLLSITAAVLGLTTVCMIYGSLAMERGDVIVAAVAMVFAAVLLLVLMVFSLLSTLAWAFSCLLIEDRKLDGWTAYAEGLRIVCARPKAMMRYGWVHYIVLLAGALACGIGQLFVAPIIFGSLTHTYRELCHSPGEPPMSRLV